MDIGVQFIVFGLLAWLVAYGSKALFVNSSDEENPYRRLLATLGYAGLAVAVWGVIVMLFADSL